MAEIDFPLTFSVIALVISILSLVLSLLALGFFIGLRNSTHTTSWVPVNAEDLVSGKVDLAQLQNPSIPNEDNYSQDDEAVLNQMFKKISNPQDEPDDEFSSQVRIVK